MTHRHAAAAFIAASLCAVLAASCVQSADSEPIETKDEDGDVGSDPDTSSGIGGEPAPDYNWSPPADVPSANTGDSDADPDPDTSDVGGAIGGYSPSPAAPAHPPAVMPLAPCEDKCQKDYEDMAAACGSWPTGEERKTCANTAYARYKGSRSSVGVKRS